MPYQAGPHRRPSREDAKGALEKMNRRLLSKILTVLALTGSAWGQTVPDTTPAPRDSPNVEALRNQIDLMARQLQLGKLQNQVMLEGLQQEVARLKLQRDIFNQQFPDANVTPLSDWGVTGSNTLTYPQKLQMVRAFKRLTTGIGEQIGKPEIKDELVLVITKKQIVEDILKYREALASLMQCQINMRAALKLKLIDDGKDLAESSNESAAFLLPAAKSLVSNTASIFQFFQSSTKINGSDLQPGNQSALLNAQLCTSLHHNGWQVVSSDFFLGSAGLVASDLRDQYHQAQGVNVTLAAKLDEANKAVADSKQATADTAPANTTAASNATVNTTAGDISTATTGNTPIINRRPSDSSNSGRNTTSSGPVAPKNEKTPDTQPKPKKLNEASKQEFESAMAQFKVISDQLTKVENKVPLLEQLNKVGALVNYVDGNPNKVNVLMAQVVVAEGGNRLIESLFNAGSLSHTAGVGVYYTLLAPDNTVRAADAVFEYVGWQRLQDEGPDIPLHFKDDKEYRSKGTVKP